jgi:hypothetical protein
MKKTIKIGGASGYWGESTMSTPQFLAAGGLDYLVYDYLAEITMSILARAKAKDPNKGYATDFVDGVMRPYLKTIADSGVKVLSNAGGVNPLACASAVRGLIKAGGLDLRVAVVTGDDLLPNLADIGARAPSDIYSGANFPDPKTIASINCYLGAFPIAAALSAGADIVITGRSVDSAVTLGACIHAFGWSEQDWDKLASGSLAGHILECGPQATGGNFTDWEEAGDIANIGYPIAEISNDGSFVTTKPPKTGGIVNVGTVSEQMLYEIGDPRNYILPDVSCDFSQVTLSQVAPNRVRVSPAIGRPAPAHYKTCLSYMDGYRAGTFLSFYGVQAGRKAKRFFEAGLTRAEDKLKAQNLAAFSETSYEIIGAGSQMGTANEASEVVLKAAVKHPDAIGAGIFLKELAGLGLATPPGLSGFTGAGRARPSPVVRLFSYLTPKSDVNISIDLGDKILTHKDAPPPQFIAPAVDISPPPAPDDACIAVPLIKLAWGRSGDKGNKANIGIIARQAEYVPYIWAALSEEMIAGCYSHFMDDQSRIERFYLPGSKAVNILLHAVLGGGGAASLRNDAQAKGYAQVLLARDILVSTQIARQLDSEA